MRARIAANLKQLSPDRARSGGTQTEKPETPTKVELAGPVIGPIPPIIEPGYHGLVPASVQFGTGIANCCSRSLLDTGISLALPKSGTLPFAMSTG
jgi:hypothetical protein